MTLKQAYKDAGYRLKNPRNSWSAVRDDGSGVALTIWADQIGHKSSEPWVMDIRDSPVRDLWMHRVGNLMRKEHIQFALKHLDGEVDLILCHAEDQNAEPRKVAKATFWAKRRGFISPQEFDPETGEFRIEIRAAKE